MYSRIYALSKESELVNRLLSNLLLSEEDSEPDDTYLYGVSIIHKFFQYLPIDDFYSSFASTKYPILSPSQLLILKIFHEYTIDHPTYKFRVHNYYFICSILPQIIYTLDLPTDLYSPTHLYTHAPLSKENEDIQRTLAKEAVPLVFDIVSNYPNNYSEEVRKLLCENDIHLIVIAILKVPAPLSQKTIDAAAKEGIIIPPAPEFSLSWPVTLRTAAMKVLCNLTYQNREMQDLVRTSDCIIHILDNMKIDKQNPTLREWALFTVRNICEDNEENQKAIADLKME